MCTLREANRALLDAIEEPPETGTERRLDDLAATLWSRSRRDGPGVDPGTCCRLRHKLRTLADRSPDRRARHLVRARERLDAYAAEYLDGTV